MSEQVKARKAASAKEEFEKLNRKSYPGKFFNFISRPGLEKLKEYKYTAGDSSIGDRLMAPFWNWFIELIPLVSLPFSKSF